MVAVRMKTVRYEWRLKKREAICPRSGYLHFLSLVPDERTASRGELVSLVTSRFREDTLNAILQAISGLTPFSFLIVTER